MVSVINILYDTYYKKLSACYLGKAIGGTLGMPFEGKCSTNDISYYSPVPNKICSNDDLDLQIIWLETVVKKGLPVNRFHLSEAWCHLNFGPDEYGVALHNLRSGLFAPLCGSYGNKFCDGMGAAIRSELWAALSPGNPDLAAVLAKEDACIDHCGSGISASVFLSAVESLAYIESDIEKLISKGLSFIRNDYRFSSAIKDTVLWWNQLQNVFSVREKILKKYKCDNWSDVTINISFIILSLLAGGGDFGSSISCAVNCGYDTDCTAASLGALLGIIDPDSIDKKWSKPIGDKISVSPQVLGLRPPETISELSEKIAALSKRCNDFYSTGTVIINVPENICMKAEKIPCWCNNISAVPFDCTELESLVCVSPIVLNLLYPEKAALKKDDIKTFTAFVSNPYETEMRISMRITLPDCYAISNDFFEFTLEPAGTYRTDFDIKSYVSYKSAFDSIDFHFTVNGIPFDVHAGLICAYPWHMLSDSSAPKGEYSPAYSFVKKIESGPKSMFIDVRPAMPGEVAFTCQGTRPLKMYLNGRLLIYYNAQVYVPGLHRGQSALGQLKKNWNRIEIELEDGDAGEVYYAIGNPIDWIWLNTLEWREPKDCFLSCKDRKKKI